MSVIACIVRGLALTLTSDMLQQYGTVHQPWTKFTPPPPKAEQEEEEDEDEEEEEEEEGDEEGSEGGGKPSGAGKQKSAEGIEEGQGGGGPGMHEYQVRAV